jgi:NAD(P)-dependent dehydrogenase (short-subunit alcohol dehydrogenase family)
LPTERFLDGRHAIVTGGSRGIGAAIAAALAARGAAVTLMARDGAALEQVAAALRATSSAAVGVIPCDVTDADAVDRAFARARSERGEAYVLVNNAGQAEGSPFLETSADLWDRMLAVNLTSAYHCTRQVLAGMLDAGAGRIVNIASTSGLKGYRNITAYTASKHGLVGLTRALAAETARAGITVNAVCPAYADTDMARHAVANIVRDMKKTEDEARALIARTVPRGTLIEPAEIAGTVAFLCSPDASGISGQAIVVAGGDI